MKETGVYLFRCIRCCAAFMVRSKDEKYGGLLQFRKLEVNDCPVCHKGGLEYVGVVFSTEDSPQER